MPMENRAAQFAPFAALTGYEEAVAETERLTDNMLELSEDELTTLSRQLDYAIQTRCIIDVTYFEKDKTKPGGSYRTAKGLITKTDEIDRTIKLNTGQVIGISAIVSITGEGLDDM